MMAYTTTIAVAARAMSQPIELLSSSARTNALLLLPADAVGALCLLAGGVGSDGRPLDDETGVHDQRVPADLHGEVVEAARRGPALLLADTVVLRAVARALEPLRGQAVRDAATEVHALLVERDDPGLHTCEDRR